MPFPAAGTTDLLARILSEPLGARLGQPVVVENRGGAGGNIGADAVAKSTDGHTLLMTTIGTAAINYSLYRNTMPYKPEDLAAVSNMAEVPNVIIAAPNLEARTLPGGGGARQAPARRPHHTAAPATAPASTSPASS